MSRIHAEGGIREATIEITVIRADGTREEHGVVSYYHKNPLRRLAWAVNRKLRSQHGDVCR